MGRREALPPVPQGRCALSSPSSWRHLGLQGESCIFLQIPHLPRLLFPFLFCLQKQCVLPGELRKPGEVPSSQGRVTAHL